MGGWIKKTWYIRTLESYSALKKKEILSFAITWMNLEDIMLTQVSQSQKNKYYIIPLYKIPRVV